jgi:hypothetical protein
MKKFEEVFELHERLKTSENTELIEQIKQSNYPMCYLSSSMDLKPLVYTLDPIRERICPDMKAPDVCFYNSLRPVEFRNEQHRGIDAIKLLRNFRIPHSMVRTSLWERLHDFPIRLFDDGRTRITLHKVLPLKLRRESLALEVNTSFYGGYNYRNRPQHAGIFIVRIHSYVHNFSDYRTIVYTEMENTNFKQQVIKRWGLSPYIYCTLNDGSDEGGNRNPVYQMDDYKIEEPELAAESVEILHPKFWFADRLMLDKERCTSADINQKTVLQLDQKEVIYGSWFGAASLYQVSYSNLMCNTKTK